MTGCASRRSAETEHHHSGEAAQGSREDHGAHGEGEEEPLLFDRGAHERLQRRRCEHELSILDCDDCRYEVGAVEVAPALLAPDGDDLLRTSKLEARSHRRQLRLTGEVSFDERRLVHVSPRVIGMVRHAFVTLGDEVEAGAKLLVMESVELGQLRSREQQARARLELAQKIHDQEARLHERRIASGREEQRAETALREARIELESQRAQLRLLGSSTAGLDRADLRALRGGALLLTAPLGGTVVAMHAVKGERLTPEEPVITIADLSKVWVWADVYERDLEALLTASAAGSPRASVRVAAFPERRFEGAVVDVGAVMEAATRTVRVRVEVDNEARLLRPGMFANVDVDVESETRAIVIPAEAVMIHEERSFVFVAVGPQRFLRRDVTARSIGGGLLELVDGVDVGEEVVVRGAFLLKSDVLRERMGAGCAH